MDIFIFIFGSFSANGAESSVWLDRKENPAKKAQENQGKYEVGEVG